MSQVEYNWYNSSSFTCKEIEANKFKHLIHEPIVKEWKYFHAQLYTIVTIISENKDRKDI